MMNIPLRRYILYDLVCLYLDIGNVNGKDQDCTAETLYL